MKTKMKSAFAFIAVALMIMVAVVPMVGVFTEDSSADVTVVPEVPSDKKITISGKVMGANGTSIADVLVKVEGDGVNEYVLTTNSGYVATVYSLGKDLTVSVVVEGDKYANITGKTTANPVLGYTFSEQKLTKVSVSVKDVDFKAGYVAVSGNLEYKNVTDKYEAPVSVSYKVGEETGATSVMSVKGTYSILVPAGSKDVTIFAGGFTSVKITDVGTSAQTSKTLKHATLNLRTITINEGDIAKDVISGNTLSITPVDGSRVTINTIGSIEDKKVRVEYTLADATETLKNTNVKISDSLGFGKEITGDITSVASYTYNAYAIGEIKAGSVPVYTNSVSIKFYKDDGTTEVTDASTTATVVGNKYYAPLGKITSTDAKKIKASFETNELVKGSSTATSISTSSKTTANITVANDLVNKFSLITVTIAGTSGITIEVSGEAKTIGEKDGKIVTTSATQTFYAETGKNILIKPTSGVFDVESREFVVSGATTVLFNINTKEYTNADYPVEDAAGNALKDVEVFYKIGSGTYNTTAIKTDKDGKFKITVNSNVSVDDVLVYFKDAKYTFNFNKDKPFALSSTDDKYWKANEQTLTFEVKDAAGKDIANISGLALQFAKYKIHAVGAGVNAFDMIGTASDVTYDATTKKFSFIAESIPASTDDYRVAYGISVKSNTTDYTFATITEYAENLVIEANEQTFTGKVTDAATSDAKELKGMTVAVYGTDGKTKLSKDVTTLNDGSFSVISKSGTLKAVDPNGVYTFNDGTADSSTGVYTIKANEQTYSGEVKDADNKLVKNAKITVKVVDADGKTIGSVATVGKDGKYSIITKLTAGNKVVATDADAKRTFKDVVIGTSAMVIPDVVSGQYTLSGTVKEMTSNKAIKDITVTLSTYSATVDSVLVSTAVTNEKGEYSFFVNEKAGYGVVATSSGNYIFSEGKMSFTDHVANIVTKYAISEGTVEEVTGGKVLSGIKVTAYGVDDVVVGEYVTDKVGKFKYPAIVNESGVSLIKFKAVDPNGAYTFADGLTSDDIKAKEKTVTVTIKADDGSTDKLPLAGVTVNFLKGEKVVKTATTDAKGKASVIIAPSAYDKVKAVDGNTAYGAMTFDSILTTDGMIYADQTVYSGFYANGDVVSGVVVTYEMSKGDAYVEKGKAVVIDNKYYIASVADEADKIVITANAQGFYAVNTFNSLSTIGESDLKIKEKPGIVKVDEDDVLFGEFYTVYNATYAQVGDKIILRASEVAYAPLEDGNETTVVKYKFDGWYVNGVKVSDDLEYVYTVTESCLVYADYKASTYETASDDNGISPSVLVIGIAAVIVALIAVVYTVIQKKE